MTTYSFGSSLQMTEFFENAPLYNMTNNNLYNNSANLSPFYYEASSNTVNFGYGLNLQAAAGNSALRAEINSELTQIGVSITDSQWAIIANQNSSASSLQGIVSTLNSFAEESIPSVIQSIANTLSAYYYTNNALPDLQGKIETYNTANPTQQIIWNNLSAGVVAALLDLQYNTGGSFLGSALLQAIATGDLESIAYELARVLH